MGAANALKLRVKDWMTLRSRWTLVLQKKNYFCRPVLSY